MCGIGLVIQPSPPEYDSSSSTSSASCLPSSSTYWSELGGDLAERLSRRGPNHSARLTLPATNTTQHFSITFLASVLHIQGDVVTKQPVVDSHGNILLWNGEVFGGYEDWSVHESDTTLLMQTLEYHISNLVYSNNESLSGEVVRILMDVLGKVEGPYAFIYYHTLSQTLFFGRDPFGRRSLLSFSVNSQIVALSSVASDNSSHTSPDDEMTGIWEEINIVGIHMLSLQSTGNRIVRTCPWPATQLRLARPIVPIEAKPEVLIKEEENDDEKGFADTALQMIDIVKNALKRRIRRCSRQSAIGVLFSGGIDSLLLAACLHLSLEELGHSPSSSIDLINIIFSDLDDPGNEKKEKEEAPDRLAGLAGLQELQTLFPNRDWRLVQVDVTMKERNLYEDRIKSLIKPLDSQMDLNIGSAFWFASRGRGRVLQTSADFFNEDLLNCHPLLRRGAAQALQSVGLDEEKIKLRDLRAARRAKTQKGNGNTEEAEETTNDEDKCKGSGCHRVAKVGCKQNCCKRCCDRLHCDETLERWEALYQTKQTEGLVVYLDELNLTKNSCPVHGNSPGKRANEVLTNLVRRFERKIGTKIAERALPSTKGVEDHAGEDQSPSLCQVGDSKEEEGEMMQSLPQKEDLGEDYESQCVALVVGIGADEQLAGYGRHRTVFIKGGEAALVEELNMDLTRLWTRNLGRDDRCISDHGREAWFPYLDEKFVAFLQRLPMSQITNLNEGPGVGDKKLLRVAARSLGLVAGSELVKRAIQFGSLAAKQTSLQYYGSRRKGKGQSKI
eukprot:gene8027-8854_t